MRRNSTNLIISAVLLMLCMLPSTANSQSTPKYSNTSVGNFTRNSLTWGSDMFCSSSGNRKFQRIFLPEELPGGQPGMIDSIYFMRFANQTSSITLTNLKIEIGFVDNRSFTTTTFETGLTVGRNSNYTIPTGNGNEWFGLPLTTPIFYDPNKTMVLIISYSGISGACLDMRTTLENIPGNRMLRATSPTATTGFRDDAFLQFGINTTPSSGVDVFLQELVSPQERCGETAASPKIRVFNSGTDSTFDIDITFKVTGTLGGSPYSNTFTHTYTDTLKSQQGGIITLPGTINTSTGGDLDFEIYISAPNDNVATNDTIKTSIYYPGKPAPPNPQDVSQCGEGVIPLVATGVGANDSCIWTSDIQGTQFIGFGASTTSFNDVKIGSYTYYARTAKEFTDGSMTTDFSLTFVCSNDYTEYNGGMFTVYADKQALLINGLDVYTSRTASTNYRVYYRYGSYEGYENDPGSWTLLMDKTDNFVAAGAAGNTNEITFPQGLILSEGDSIAFYFTTVTGNDVYLQGRGVTKKDELASIKNSPALHGNQPFGNQFTLANFGINMDVNYQIYCPSAPVPFSVDVKPRPVGTAMSLDPGSSDLSRISSPDIVADSDTIAYKITPPSGFNNTDYSTTWEISSVTFVTDKGTVLPANQHVLIPPTATDSAKVLFIPEIAWSDSTVLMYYTVKDLNNQCDSTSVRSIFVAPRPNANFNSQAQCAGDAIEFENTSSILSGAMTHQWDFGDGTTSDRTNPLKVYNTANNYTVTLIATSQYGYADTIVQQVVVLEKPLIDFRPINACDGDSVRFSNNTTLPGGGTINYEWDFGDGSAKDITESPAHLYPASGEYTVTLIATANGCVSVKKRNAFQFPQPTAAFTVENNECNSTKEVNFVNNSTIASGRIGSLWNFGDGFYSTEFSSKHTFDDAGNQTVKLKIQSEFGCIDSVEVQFILKESPVAQFDNSQTCDIDPVSFTNNSTEPVGANVDYAWNFGDPTSGNNTSALKNPIHKYSLPGPRKVTLIANADNGCSDTATKDIVIGVQPQAAFDIDPAVCEGEPLEIVNKTTISRGDIEVTYTWDFGDGSNSNDVSPVKTYTTPGEYTVSLTSTSVEGGCNDTISKQVKVNVTPECDFTAESNKSGDRRVNFTVNNNPEPGSKFEWNFGDGGFSDQASPQHQYTFDGGYFIKLRIITPGGCECSTIQRFDINKTSTDDIDLESRVSVYPNPSDGVFNVKISDVKDEISVKVYNALGQLVNETTTTNSGELVFDLSDQPAGVYTVKVQAGDETYTTKVTLL